MKYRKKPLFHNSVKTVSRLLYYHIYTMIDYNMTYTLRPLLTFGITEMKMNLALVQHYIKNKEC